MKKIIFLVATLFGSFAHAQSSYKFLTVDYSPKAAALGGIYVCSTDDPIAFFYNPASVRLIEKGATSFAYSKFLLDINGASAATVFEVENTGKFATGIQYVNYGSFTKADENGNKLGNFSANDIALSAAYSYEYFENFNVGVSAKIIYSGIEKYSSTAAAFDFGILYSFVKHLLNLGLSLNNFGTQLSAYSSVKEELPLDLRFGVTKKLEQAPLKFYAGFYNLLDKDLSFADKIKQYALALEFDPGKTLVLRFSYDGNKRNDLKVASSAGLSGISLGVGLRFEKFNFDYSFSSWGEIGSVHRLGIMANMNDF